MKLIGYDSSVTNAIKGFDERQFYNIVKFVNELSIDDFDVYEGLYVSKYNSFPSENERIELNRKLEYLRRMNPLLETDKQGTSYEWVYINKREKGEEAFRYYFGINPMNLYKLVEKLTEKFLSLGIPVSFKYQQEGKRKFADRIILYTSSKNKDKVERAINEVYYENQELFSNSERTIPWIYESKTPNVYFAPESLDHHRSYGEKFASALMGSKKIFHYLYQEDKVRTKEQLEVLKKIVLSTMFRNGLFLNKNDGRMFTEEQGITTFYDKENNVLRNVIDEKNGNYYEVIYDSSIEAKKCFLRNFYTVKTVTNQPGVQKRVLSRTERNRELYYMLYPHEAINPTQRKK